MQIQSSHSMDDRGADAYFTPREAIESLIALEHQNFGNTIWEPAAGDGAIVKPLREKGYKVVASDLHDYGLDDCAIHADYLKGSVLMGVDSIITNPPYKLALEFAQKAISEVPYVAFLLRTNFLESVGRFDFFKITPPARLLISSRRLPMMHRHGWTGPKAPSNTCFAWFIWDRKAQGKTLVDWFDWKEYV